MREIGIRSDGVYSRESCNADLQQQFKCGSSLRRYQTRQECENGKSLESMLAMDYTANYTPIKFLVFVLEGANFELDVENWKPLTKHVGYYTLPTTASYAAGHVLHVGEQEELNIPFKRVAMQVRITQDEFTHVAHELGAIADAHPVSEPAEVLRDVMNFSRSFREDTFEKKMENLKDFSNILYHLSDSMRKKVFHNVTGLLEAHWKNELLLDNKYDSKIVREAKKLLWDLIVTAHDQPHVALASCDHLRYISKFIHENTKHMYYALSVEKSNFHTIFRTIENINKQTAIAFCSIQVAGKMSGLDISRLVDQSIHGNVRILLTFSPQVLLSLQITQKIDSVRIPASLRRAHQKRVREYSQLSVVGELTLLAHTMFTNAPILLEDDLTIIYQILDKRQEWIEECKKWLVEPIDDQNSSEMLYRLIVSDDSTYVVKALHGICDGDVNLITVDCHERDVEVEMARYFGTEENAKEKGPKKQNRIFLVLNVHLLSEYHQLHVAAYTIAAGYRLVFAMPAFNPECLTLRISNKMLRGKLWRPIVEWEHIRRNGESSPEFKSDTNKQQTKENLVEACEFLTIDNKILGDIVDTIFEDEGKSGGPLHVQIARLCRRAVLVNGRIEKDISFYLFITNAQTCQWLPQVQRVVAWICTVLLANDETYAAKLATQCKQLGTNIHSLHLVAFFGEEYHSACSVISQVEDVAGMLPSYFAATVDNSTSKQEHILQQCVQGSELSWDDPGLGFFTLDFLFALVETYHQPLKLLATIPSTSLFHLLESSTRERYPKAIGILEKALQFLSRDSLTYKLFQRSASAKIFVSVLKWSLLSNDSVSSEKVPILPEDIENLIAARIPIFINKAGAAEITLPLILALEGPDGIIYQQSGLREYLSDARHDYFTKYNTAHLGKATLDFIFNANIRAIINAQNNGANVFLANPFLRGLVAWFDGNSTDEQRGLVEREGWRLTEQAVAFFIAQATRVVTSDWVSFLRQYIARTMNTGGYNILNLILVHLKTLTPSGNVVSKLVCALLEADITLELSIQDPFLDSLVASMKQQTLRPLAQHFETGNQGEQPQELLPVDSCECIVRLFLEEYSDKRVNYPFVDVAVQVHLHKTWLSENGCLVIFDKLQQDIEESQASRRMLSYLFWLLCPSKNIPFLPHHNEQEIFKKLVEEADLADRIKSNLSHASQFAKFLVAPYCLDLCTLNYYNTAVGEELVGVKKYLVAMANGSFPILLHVPIRPLPVELRNYYEQLPINATGFTFSCEGLFGIDVSSGVDVARITKNVAALLHILVSFSEKKPVWGRQEYDITFWFMAHIISAHIFRHFIF